ncbi:MAG: hypothetical protein ACJAZS_000439 [Alteromonas naphthalenivorans]|jgi:hypothetical protein
MSDFLLKFIGISIVWACIVAISYLMIRWCFDYEMSWKRVGMWATGTFVGVMASIAMYYILPQRWQDITNVLFDHLICGAALHMLLFRVDGYLINKFGSGISRSKFYLGVIIIYGFMILDGLVVIQMNSHVIVKISDMVVEYLTRSAVLMCLVLEIKFRNQPKVKDVVQDYDMEDY